MYSTCILTLHVNCLFLVKSKRQTFKAKQTYLPHDANCVLFVFSQTLDFIAGMSVHDKVLIFVGKKIK